MGLHQDAVDDVDVDGACGGEAFEHGLAVIFHALAGGEGQRFLWLDMPMGRDGMPTNKGRTELKQGAKPGRGNGGAFPDYLFSPFEPGSLNPTIARKSFIVAEAKLSLSGAYSSWKYKQTAQRVAIKNHAAKYEYVPIAFLFTARTGRGNSDALMPKLRAMFGSANVTLQIVNFGIDDIITGLIKRKK